MRRILTTDSVRSFVFGVEDSLVSTLGLVSGIAAVGNQVPMIIVTGFILVIVEAFSMAVGTLISDNSAKEFRAKGQISLRRSVFPSVIMFFSYIIAGFVVLFPYLFFSSLISFRLSIILSIISLFILGLISGILTGVHPFKRGLIMVLIGGSATLIGILAGVFINSYLT